MESKLEDYRLEIKALQVADFNRAKENGFNTRKSWYNFIINQEQDEIALGIISLSNRYGVPLERAANDFDPSMLMRVGKIIKNINNAKIIK